MDYPVIKVIPKVTAYDFSTNTEIANFGIDKSAAASQLRALADRIDKGGELVLVRIQTTQEACFNDYAHSVLVVEYSEMVPRGELRDQA